MLPIFSSLAPFAPPFCPSTRFSGNFPRPDLNRKSPSLSSPPVCCPPPYSFGVEPALGSAHTELYYRSTRNVPNSWVLELSDPLRATTTTVIFKSSVPIPLFQVFLRDCRKKEVPPQLPLCYSAAQRVPIFDPILPPDPHVRVASFPSFSISLSCKIRRDLPPPIPACRNNPSSSPLFFSRSPLAWLGPPTFFPTPLEIGMAFHVLL